MNKVLHAWRSGLKTSPFQLWRFDSIYNLNLRKISNTNNQPLNFCVVGSGPAGFYTVSQLLKTFKDRARVTILERLPTPFGLVRSGVAPDHPETKNVIHQFSDLGKDPRVTFLGNVRVGQDVPLSDLRSFFNGVILAYGAEGSRPLNIPGRHLEGIFTARDFVWWYNGHPEYVNLPINLSRVKKVAILGLGNVALDCARILLQPPTRLDFTDIAEHAMSQLRNSSVEEVTIFGRRGPAQASFTAKELREVLNMESIQVKVNPQDLSLTGTEEAALKSSRKQKRVFELMVTASKSFSRELGKGRTLSLKFLRAPKQALGNDNGQIEGLELEENELVEKNGRQVAVSTGQFEQIKVDMMLEAIGYHSLSIPGAPFDETNGLIPNKNGRVLSSAESGSVCPALYVCGWVKRGASGIIGTNLVDATETVNTIAEDEFNGLLHTPNSSQPEKLIQTELERKGVQVVSFDDWSKLDKHESGTGERLQKPRLKLVDIPEMLDLCKTLKE